MWTILLLLIFLGLIGLPLLPALLELYFKSDVAPLKVVHAHQGKVDYFAEKFRTDLPALLSRESKDVNVAILNNAQNLLSDLRVINKKHRVVTFTNRHAALPEKIKISTPIYAEGNLTLQRKSVIRSALVEKMLVLGAKSRVLNWIDAASVYAEAGCRLRGRVSARHNILLNKDSTFERLSAPKIQFGQLAADANVVVTDVERDELPKPDIVHLYSNRITYHDDLLLSKCVKHFGDVVVQGNMVVAQHSMIHGSLKTHRTLILKNDCFIDGQVIAQGELEIGVDCKITGNILSETAIYIAAGCVLGAENAPIVVVSPRIVISSGALIYGSVSAYEGGMIV